MSATPSNSEDTANGESQAASNEHILIVESNSDLAEVLYRLLASRGFTASSPETAAETTMTLEASLENPVDLILIDQRSDEIVSSLSVLKEVRGHDNPDLAATPAVIVTDEGDHEQEAWKSAVDGFVTVPIHADVLIDTLLAVLGRSPDERADHRDAQLQDANT